MGAASGIVATAAIEGDAGTAVAAAVAATGGDPARTIDAGLNYILDGHNARAGLVVQNMKPSAGSSSTGVQLGIQIQE